MVLCVLIPRFELIAAAGSRRALLGPPAAIAPEPGCEQLVGEVSPAAEGLGVRRGMRLGEALARCPELQLIPPDADRVERGWEEQLTRLESIGAAVESPRPGVACFEAGGLIRLYGGNLEGVIAKARRSLATPVRIGAGPNRFVACVAAAQARPRRGALVVAPYSVRRFLSPLPVLTLHGHLEPADLPNALERLGIGTLGRLSELPAPALSDRFGRPGLRALRLAQGQDGPLRPRIPPQTLAEWLDLPEEASGQQLERATGLLVDRLLARPELGERTVRRLRLAARLVEGGGWRREATLREPSADPALLRLVIVPKLGELPAPARSLGLEAGGIGPPAARQLSLEDDGTERRRARLDEAARQARTAAGRDAVLRVVEIDPASRVPERRAILTPYFPESR